MMLLPHSPAEAFMMLPLEARNSFVIAETQKKVLWSDVTTLSVNLKWFHTRCLK